jgi:hypothetical protein
MTTLLSTSSAKLDKSQNDEFLNVILYLDPLFDKAMCPWATAACRKTCLINSGRMPMQNAKDARKARTAFYRYDLVNFKRQLKAELTLAEIKAMRQGKKLAARLNGTSDQDFSEIYAEFPNVQFYEYTKGAEMVAKLAKFDNVHVTFSKTEEHTEEQVLKVLDSGTNVAVVFKDAVPKVWAGVEVINGDLHDRRFEDDKGKIVGLKFKGNAKLKEFAVKRGFAI